MSLQLDPAIKRALRDNRQNRLHILICLLVQSRGALPMPATASDISGELNLNRDTVNDALQAMSRDGYAAQTGYGWIATSKVQQLPIAELLSMPGTQAHQPGLLPDENVFLSRRKISAPVVVVDQLASLAEDQQQQQTDTNAENFRIASQARSEVRAALQAAGIQTGKRHRELIADSWVTAERVEGWRIAAQHIDGINNPAGYVVTRLLAHDDPPTIDVEVKAEKRPSWREIVDQQLNDPRSAAYRLRQRSMENRTYDE